MTNKQHLLNLVEKHNAVIETLESLDIKIPMSDFLKLASVSVAMSREGWALVDALFEEGVRGVKINAQSGYITVPADDVIKANS